MAAKRRASSDASGGGKASSSPPKTPSRTDKVKTAALSAPLKSGDGKPYPIVGIGASAGGLDPLLQFFKSVPERTGLAYLVVQHLDPTRKSETPALLQRQTTLPVVAAGDGMPVQPDHVYAIPPDRYMVVEKGVLRLTQFTEPRGIRMPVDILFDSMAAELGERAIGVILSGSGSDGTLGLRAIKSSGGIAVAQDPATAEFDGMPRNAIATGLVDFVLPVPRMIEAIQGYVRHPYVRKNASATKPESAGYLPGVLDLLHTRRNMDFRSYKKGTIMRRVERRMGLRQIDRGGDYVQLLREDRAELNALFDDLLIRVTRFFREPEAWHYLAREIIPKLIDEADYDRPVRVWIPACATGEEAYSIAILLMEEREKIQRSVGIQVFASDLDLRGLDLARVGTYPETIASDVSAERLQRFFVRREHHFTVTQPLRDAVVFAPHNLLADPPFSRLDLVSCRNLLIYLDSEMQSRVLDIFHFGLRPGGLLMLGNSETVGDRTDIFKAVSERNHIYRRHGSPRQDRFRLTPKSAVPAQSSPPPPRAASVPGDGASLAAAREIVLERYTAACVLVSPRLEILSLFGPTQNYLTQPTGTFPSDIVSWMRGGARTKLRVALQAALRKGEPVSVRGLRIRRGDGDHLASCTVEPLSPSPDSDGLLLVVFRDESAVVAAQVVPGESDEPLVKQLEYELLVTKDDLRTSVEQLEGSNEELRAMNEEMLSMNEELQSTNEELETSKEELQSLNEELSTVNSQLEMKITLLQALNDDVTNLLTSTEIPTLFLDRAFRIRRYTPSIVRFFRMIPTDLGRPLSDITQLGGDDHLLKDAQEVLQSLVPMEVQVETPEGRVYMRRVLPYRTEDDRIEGVVVTYGDVTDRVHAAELLRDARDYSDAIVETVREPLVVLDGDLALLSANASFYRAFKLTANQAVGTRIFDLGQGEWNIPELRELLEDMLPRDTQLTDFEVRREFAGLGPRVMCLNARILDTGKQRLIMLAIEDITIKIEAEEARNEVLRQMVNYEERERHRLALELHDETGQHVTAFLLGLASLKDSYAHQSESREVIQQLQIRAEELARQLHGISLELRPLALDDHGLERALTNYIEDVSLRHHLEVDFHASGSGLGRVPPHIETVLYRVTQEALTNVVRHSQAKKVSIVLTRKIHEVSLIIEDDGDGFEAENFFEAPHGNGPHLGLRGMRERVLLAGGTMTVESHPSDGAALFVRIPLGVSNRGGSDG